ncbi:MAG: hypothetical protein SWE60_26230, partial [Thermodesulfobacteriota bacterium]|nr:hypothetical protein [Thermodesulfobacteriota bacterium]
MTDNKASIFDGFRKKEATRVPPLLFQLVVTLVLATICYFTVKSTLYLLDEDYSHLSLPVTVSIFSLHLILSFVFSLKRGFTRVELVSFFILSVVLSYFTHTLLLIILLLALFSLASFLLAGNRSSVLHYLCFMSFQLFYLVAFWTKTSYSTDEGFMILQFALFVTYATFIFAQFALLGRIGPFAPMWGHDTPFRCLGKMATLLLIVTALFWGSYWNSLNLFSSDISAKDLNESAVFTKLNFETGFAQYDHKRLSKKDLIDYLLAQKGGPGWAGSLFCLTGDRAWGLRFKKQLMGEAKRDAFLNASGSVKFWQFNVAERAYFYDRIKTMDDSIFSQQDRAIIEGWFERINLYAYKITLADVAYGALFKQKPLGLYYNQDIGFAMVAVLSKILEPRNKALVERNR